MNFRRCLLTFVMGLGFLGLDIKACSSWYSVEEQESLVDGLQEQLHMLSAPSGNASTLEDSASEVLLFNMVSAIDFVKYLNLEFSGDKHPEIDSLSQQRITQIREKAWTSMRTCQDIIFGRNAYRYRKPVNYWSDVLATARTFKLNYAFAAILDDSRFPEQLLLNIFYETVEFGSLQQLKIVFNNLSKRGSLDILECLNSVDDKGFTMLDMLFMSWTDSEIARQKCKYLVRVGAKASRILTGDNFAPLRAAYEQICGELHIA